MTDNNFSFQIIHQYRKFRVCKIDTPHGVIYTPNFYFCGTHGTVPGLPMTLYNHNILLCNTYHLMGHEDTIALSGGLHKFMGFNGPILTDSGGYQIFSLGYGSVSQEIKRNVNISAEKSSTLPKGKVKISEDGATIFDHKQSKWMYISPEISIDIQYKLGIDFVVCLDECTPFNVPKEYTKLSMERSHRWELRSLKRFQDYNNPLQRLYGIVQGGVYQDLRLNSIDFINSNPFWGVAIGGCLGSNKQQMREVVEFTMNHLNVSERPVHLLGIGKDIEDVFMAVENGIDTMDCVSVTRHGRHGEAITSNGTPVRLRSQTNDLSPIEKSCPCSTCKQFSKSYLQFLWKKDKIACGTLIMTHNIVARSKLMENIRDCILNNICPTTLK